MEKFNKMLLYMESVLAFVQYGDALEHETADAAVVFKLWKDTLKFCQFVLYFLSLAWLLDNIYIFMCSVIVFKH